MPKDDYIIALNTCDSTEIATLIANTLVSKKLAACVNIVKGIQSVYQWQGEIKHDDEILLIIKTRQSLFSQVEHTIQEQHNYELPEIIAVPISSGETNYLNWIQSATLATEQNNENK